MRFQNGAGDSSLAEEEIELKREMLATFKILSTLPHKILVLELSYNETWVHALMHSPDLLMEEGGNMSYGKISFI